MASTWLTVKNSYKNFIDWYWKDWGEKLLDLWVKKEAAMGGLSSTFHKDNTKTVWHKKTKRQLSRARSYKYIQQI